MQSSLKLTTFVLFCCCLPAMPRNISVVVEEGKGLRANKSSFCEVVFREFIHKTKEMKGEECKWNQQFSLGEFAPTDGITFRIKSKRTNRTLNEAVIPLERYTPVGIYNEEIPLGDNMILYIQLISGRFGRSLTRTASVKFVGRTLQKMLAKEEQSSHSHSPPRLHSTTSEILETEAKEETLRERSRGGRISSSTGERKRRRKARKRIKVSEIEESVDVTLVSTELSDPSENNNDCKDNQIILIPLGETEHKLFGISLDEVMKNQQRIYPDLDLTVPYFYHEAAKAVRDNGFSVQGIFRIRGKIKDVKIFKTKIDSGEQITEAEWGNIHIVTTLMKAFLRELPIPILQYDNYSIFMKAADLELDEAKAELRKMLLSLPSNNYNVIEFLFRLLHELSGNTEITQMNSENLAKVISPNLIWKEVLDITDMSVVQDAMKGNTVAQLMIENFEEIFASSS